MLAVLDRSHVLIPLAVEKDFSRVALVAGLTLINFKVFKAFNALLKVCFVFLFLLVVFFFSFSRFIMLSFLIYEYLFWLKSRGAEAPPTPPALPSLHLNTNQTNFFASQLLVADNLDHGLWGWE